MNGKLVASGSEVSFINVKLVFELAGAPFGKAPARSTHGPDRFYVKCALADDKLLFVSSAYLTGPRRVRAHLSAGLRRSATSALQRRHYPRSTLRGALALPS